MRNYEVYETNAGSLYLCIIDDDGQCKRIIEGWEYEPYGILNYALDELQNDPTAYENWDGDLVERLRNEGIYTDAQILYDNGDGMGELIADSTGYINPNMGYAGKKAFNIID